jgi:hypothetical protein
VTESSAATIPAKALRYGGLVTLAIAVVGAVAGYLAAGVPGLVSALLGAVLAAVFLGLTTASMLVAWRVTRGSPLDARFFAIVMGTWIVKLFVFIGVAIWLSGQSWLDPMVFFLVSLVAVVGTLIVDVVAFQTSRVPYVDVSLPEDEADRVEKTPSDS